MTRHYDALMPFNVPRLLRLPQVLEMVGCKRSTLLKMVEADVFPQPIKINIRNNAWLEEEVINWIEQKIRDRDDYLERNFYSKTITKVTL